jgi:hypothetical protein
VQTKVTERLWDLTTGATKLKLLARSHLSAINNARHTSLQSPTAETPAVTVGGFWKESYFPWGKPINDSQPCVDMKPFGNSTYNRNSKQSPWTPIPPWMRATCWTLDRMVTVKKLNKNSLSHVKSLCSGIFSKACRTKGSGISVNPWREAKESVRVRKAKPRVKYTQEETAAMLNALTQPEAKLFFCLLCGVGSAA